MKQLRRLGGIEIGIGVGSGYTLTPQCQVVIYKSRKGIRREDYCLNKPYMKVQLASCTRHWTLVCQKHYREWKNKRIIKESHGI